MQATLSRCSALRAVTFALALSASACAMGPNEPTHTMTAQEIATAAPVSLCPPPADGVHCHGRAIADPNGCPHPNPAPAGYGPSQLRSAYKISGTGSSSTIVAIVEAFGYPSAEGD